MRRSRSIGASGGSMRSRSIPSSPASAATSTPTGRFLGSVGFQRLLREAPWGRLDECVGDEPVYLSPDAPDEEVSARLAAYDLVAIAVCDEAQRLIGAVTVDDVIDHMLPSTWRRVRRPQSP